MNPEAKNYSEMLENAIHSLSSAVQNQEFHKLLQLDKAIRLQTSECVEACKGNEALAREITPRLHQLIGLYREVSAVCSEKSAQIKRELCQVQQNKRNTNVYLNVASRSG